MAKRRWRMCRIVFFSGASLPLFGCFFAYYPDRYDASDFEVFQYRVEIDPPCLASPSTYVDGPDITFYPPVCEATITRESIGEYIVVLGVHTDYQSGSPYLPPRAMTEPEIENMIALFSELHTNPHPQPFCALPINYSPTGEEVLRWDDLELVLSDCDRARLDVWEGRAIYSFLNKLVPGRLAEPP